MWMTKWMCSPLVETKQVFSHSRYHGSGSDIQHAPLISTGLIETFVIQDFMVMLRTHLASIYPDFQDVVQENRPRDLSILRHVTLIKDRYTPGYIPRSAQLRSRIRSGPPTGRANTSHPINTVIRHQRVDYLVYCELLIPVDRILLHFTQLNQ